MTSKIPGYKPDALELYRCQTSEELPALMHFLGGVGFTGKVEVIALDVAGRGHLFFENGRVVHAVEGATVGIDAVARMLVWQRAEIHLYRRVVAPTREFTCSTDNLIMDASLLADQNLALWQASSRTQENVPEPKDHKPPAERALGEDRSWRTIVIYMLASLGVLLLVINGCRIVFGGDESSVLPLKAGLASDEFADRITQGQAHSIDGLDLKLLPIKPGTFRRKYTDEASGKSKVAVVDITPLWMSRCEVTQKDFQAIMGVNPSAFKGPRLPVESITWSEAQYFCQRLTGIERAAGTIPAGWEYRLPTEMEWEYTLAAGEKSITADDLESFAWYRDNSDRETHPVATRKPNAWGFFDMQGNVNEWCADWLGRVPFDEDPANQTGDLRACRGGSWLQTEEYCSLDKRVPMQWESANNIIGFRPVLAPVSSTPKIRWE